MNIQVGSKVRAARFPSVVGTVEKIITTSPRTWSNWAPGRMAAQVLWSPASGPAYRTALYIDKLTDAEAQEGPRDDG